MPLFNFIATLRRSVQERGLSKTARHLGERVYRVVRPKEIPVHPFDLRHGVDTGGLVGAGGLRSGHPHDRHNTAYWGTAPSSFEGMLREWKRTLPADLSCNAYSFIDIGCGKGRVLMLASEHPFLGILGVELVPELAAIAQSNVARWLTSERECRNVTVLNADVLALSLPDNPVLLYLFNPFHSELMELLLTQMQQLAVHRSASIDFIYAFPEHAGLFQSIPNMSLLWTGEIPLSAQDTAADAFGARSQACCIYRLAPLEASPQTA